jgi:hypothetical protein
LDALLAVAYAYLVAGGAEVVTSPEQGDLARLVKRGEASVRDIGQELRPGSL